MVTRLGSNSEFTESARELYDEFVALMVVTHNMTKDNYKQCLLNREFIETRPSREIRPFLNIVRKRIHALRKGYHVHGSRKSLVAILRAIESGPGDKQVAWVRKSELERIIQLNRIKPEFDRLPGYARIGLTLDRQPESTHLPLWLLEAKLYEDACLLFNSAQAAYKTADPLNPWSDEAKPIEKMRETLLRASFVAIFQFVESYLNGIAADYLLTHPDIDDKTKALLSENPRHISFRDKALQYPRIYSGLEHPPFQESNCPELSLLLEKVKIRDSLVHPSSLPIDQSWTKELAFLELTLEDVSQLVDAAVAFTRKVEQGIGRNSVILEWILPRDEDGLFPPESLQ